MERVERVAPASHAAGNRYRSPSTYPGRTDAGGISGIMRLDRYGSWDQ